MQRKREPILIVDAWHHPDPAIRINERCPHELLLEAGGAAVNFFVAHSLTSTRSRKPAASRAETK